MGTNRICQVPLPMLGKKSLYLIPVGKFLSQWVLNDSNLWSYFQHLYTDMSDANLMQILESRISVMCLQRSLVYLTILTFPFQEFNLTAKESKTRGKKANKKQDENASSHSKQCPVPKGENIWGRARETVWRPIFFICQIMGHRTVIIASLCPT